MIEERFSSFPWRVWHKPTRKMYYVIQWNHRNYMPYLLVVDADNSMLRLETSDCEFQTWTMFKDTYKQNIYESDILMIIMRNGTAHNAIVERSDGVLGVHIGSIFTIFPGIDAVLREKPKEIVVIGNMKEPIMVSPTRDQRLEERTN